MKVTHDIKLKNTVTSKYNKLYIFMRDQKQGVTIGK